MQEELERIRKKYLEGEWGLVSQVAYNGPCAEYANPDEFLLYMKRTICFNVDIKWMAAVSKAYVYIPRVPVMDEYEKAVEEVTEKFIELLDKELQRFERKIRSVIRGRQLTPDGLKFEFAPAESVTSGFKEEDFALVRRLLPPRDGIQVSITSDNTTLYITLSSKWE